MPRKGRTSFHKARKDSNDSSSTSEKNAVHLGAADILNDLTDNVELIRETNSELEKAELIVDVSVTDPSLAEKHDNSSINTCSESNGTLPECDTQRNCVDGEDLCKLTPPLNLVNVSDNSSDSLQTEVELGRLACAGHGEFQKGENGNVTLQQSECDGIPQNQTQEHISRTFPEVENDNFEFQEGNSCCTNGLIHNSDSSQIEQSDCTSDSILSTASDAGFACGFIGTNGSDSVHVVEDKKENGTTSENFITSKMTTVTSETTSSSCTSLISEESLVEPKSLETATENLSAATSEFYLLENDALIEKLKQQNLEIMRLKEENGRLQHQLTNSSYEVIPLSEATADIYEVQMAALEKTITQLQREVDVYRDKLSEHDEFSKNSIANLKRDFNVKLDKLAKRLEISEKEKETMVVKYAQSEKSALTLKKSVEEMERKLRENVREKEMLMGKVRSLTNERSRLNQTVDNKRTDISNLQRETERLKEEILSKDIKIKWGQNKLKTEMDAHKETLWKLDKIQQKLKETREESEQVRRDCQAMIHTYQESEEIKSNSLDLQLREKETELELERQEKSDQEEVFHMMRNELEALKKKHKYSLDESNALTMKIQCLERERLDYEQNLSKLKEQLNVGQQEIVDLHAKLAEMENLKTQIDREKEKVAVNQSEIERLRQANVELQIDMEACRRKEGELLEFTERLTSKNVTLQSEYSCLEAKFQAQEREFNRLSKLVDEMDQKNSLLCAQLQDEQQLRKQETQLLARKLAEKTKTVDSMNLKLEEQNNDNAILRRKNASSIRELTREIQVLRRRLDNYELSRSGATESHALGSRSSSTGSLDTVSAMVNSNGQGNHTVGKLVPQHGGLSQDTRTSNSTEPVLEPSRQMLIERIVKLQRAHARKNEKIEFLEEHVNQLISELKKKSKVIQNYVMREEAGALSTISMDQNKAELSRKGGIMASLYTSHQVDDGMTIELALEISRKLQTVLEDTLLKNITLKENIKTLGDEIERLSKENKRTKN